jgi:hypothetical protein
MTPDAIGYVASSLVFATYCMKQMISLRITAIFGNVAFIAYGLSLGHSPIWALHAALLPLNGWRLAQAIACQRKAGATGRRRAIGFRPRDDVWPGSIRSDARL